METPIVCPVCWDHAVVRIDDVKLTASTPNTKNVSGAFVYRCSHWHVFALFDQFSSPKEVRDKERLVLD